MFPSRHVYNGFDTMTDSSVNHAWEFNCVLENGEELKSWFYADTKQDASNRIKEYMGAQLISIKEIDDPLEHNKKQIEKDKIKEELAKKII
jgi:23S rRNA pseudoU1915 N3-methylase RlmH